MQCLGKETKGDLEDLNFHQNFTNLYALFCWTVKHSYIFLFKYKHSVFPLKFRIGNILIIKDTKCICVIMFEYAVTYFILKLSFVILLLKTSWSSPPGSQCPNTKAFRFRKKLSILQRHLIIWEDRKVTHSLQQVEDNHLFVVDTNSGAQEGGTCVPHI